jgi:hypothetical protein
MSDLASGEEEEGERRGGGSAEEEEHGVEAGAEVESNHTRAAV